MNEQCFKLVVKEIEAKCLYFDGQITWLSVPKH